MVSRRLRLRMALPPRLIQWILVAMLAVITLAVLGSTMVLATSLTKELGCSIPDRLSYNVVAAIITLIAIALLFVPLVFDTGILWIKPARTRVPWPLFVAAIVFIAVWAFAAVMAFWGTRDVCGACPSKTLIVLGGSCYDCLDRVEGDADIEMCRNNENVTVSALEQKYHFYRVTQGLNLVQTFGFFALAIAAAMTLVRNRWRSRELSVKRHNQSAYYRPAPYPSMPPW